MKLLLFSDVHRDLRACERLVEMSREANVVIGAGDFATMRQGLQEPIDCLSQIPVPVVLVPGNSETDEELRDACRNWPQVHLLHGSGVTLQGVKFWGLGGAVPPTPFGHWSFDYSEDVAISMLYGAKGHDVLICHAPPKGTLDVDSRGMHLGSRAVRDVMKSAAPRLLVCGHIHASAGRMERVGRTAVVNAGPQGVWIDLTDDEQVKGSIG